MFGAAFEERVPEEIVANHRHEAAVPREGLWSACHSPTLPRLGWLRR
jgi:hypothetical protein